MQSICLQCTKKGQKNTAGGEKVHLKSECFRSVHIITSSFPLAKCLVQQTTLILPDGSTGHSVPSALPSLFWCNGSLCFWLPTSLISTDVLLSRFLLCTQKNTKFISQLHCFITFTISLKRTVTSSASPIQFHFTLIKTPAFPPFLYFIKLSSYGKSIIGTP